MVVWVFNKIRSIRIENKIKGIKKRAEVEKYLKSNNFRDVAQPG